MKPAELEAALVPEIMPDGRVAMDKEIFDVLAGLARNGPELVEFLHELSGRVLEYHVAVLRNAGGAIDNDELERVHANLVHLAGVGVYKTTGDRSCIDGMKCRVCGCTDLEACRTADGSPCSWVQLTLCSNCPDLFVPKPSAELS